MNETLQMPTSTRTQNATARLRVIVFRVGSLNLAIRIAAIVKILKNTAVASSGTNSFGIAHVGDREVTVLDLQRQLFAESAVSSQGTASHIILLQTTAGEPFGIPVETVPILMDIPIDSWRVLPESYRRSDTLSMATHVAILPQKEESTLFLIDPSLLKPF